MRHSCGEPQGCRVFHIECVCNQTCRASATEHNSEMGVVFTLLKRKECSHYSLALFLMMDSCTKKATAAIMISAAHWA